tara:strand:- start:36 stop:332 length:297 start_codon:yes stop_codon:yes gene_type:complete
MMINSATSGDWDDFWSGPNPDNIPSIFSNKMTPTTVKENIIDRDELQEAYIQELIDGMDFKTMEAFIYDTINDYLDKYSVDELIEEVQEYNPELLENE